MLYANTAYYRQIYKGGRIPDGLAEHFLALACDDVDALTFCRIRDMGFDELTVFQQDRVQRAVCMQAENLYCGGDPAAGGDGVEVKLGDYAGSGEVPGVRRAFCKRALALLMQTGLCDPGLKG